MTLDSAQADTLSGCCSFALLIKCVSVSVHVLDDSPFDPNTEKQIALSKLGLTTSLEYKCTILKRGNLIPGRRRVLIFYKNIHKNLNKRQHFYSKFFF